MAKRPLSAQKLILAAVNNIAKAQEVIQKNVNRHEKIIESQGRDIVALENRVTKLRNSAIIADLNSGMNGREVAVKYHLSEGRISQIRKPTFN